LRFPHRYGTGSGGIHDLLEPALKMTQGGNVLEPDIGEGSAVVAAESVVVVVVDEDGKRRFGLIELRKRWRSSTSWWRTPQKASILPSGPSW
jgi:hypothetical protein